MARIEVVQDRDKWIGASDVPIIMGHSKFQPDVFRFTLEKLGFAIAEDNPFTKPYRDQGDALEPLLREFTARSLGITELTEGTIIVDEINLRVNFDGLCQHDRYGFFEGKVVGTDEDVDYHQFQVQAEHLAWTAKYGKDTVGILTFYHRANVEERELSSDPEMYEILPDYDMQRNIVQYIVRYFDAMTYVKDSWPQYLEGKLELGTIKEGFYKRLHDGEILDIGDEIVRLEAESKAISKKVDELKSRAIAIMETSGLKKAGVITYVAPTINVVKKVDVEKIPEALAKKYVHEEVVTTVNVIVDYDGLLAEDKDIYAQAVTETEVVSCKASLRINAKRKE